MTGRGERTLIKGTRIGIGWAGQIARRMFGVLGTHCKGNAIEHHVVPEEESKLERHHSLHLDEARTVRGKDGASMTR